MRDEEQGADSSPNTPHPIPNTRHPLWRHRDFLIFWSGQTVSLFGSQVTLLALPLTAALTLNATPGQMGLLTACGTLPGLLFGLFAGVWVDRHRRRPVLLCTNFGQAALLMLIPAAAWLGESRIELLYVVAFTSGLLALFFRIAYASYLPSLVQRGHLADGNAKLQMSQSAAQVAGPGMAGGLVQLLTAPVAIAVDAASFLFSGISILFVRSVEPPPSLTGERRSMRSEIGEGLRAVFGNPYLRTIGIWAGMFNMFGTAMLAVFLIFVTRDLGIAPGVLGLVFAVGSASGILGAVLAGRIVERLGLGRAMVGAGLVASLSQVLLPLAGGPTFIAVGIIVASRLVFGLVVPLLQINIVTLQQAVTPDRLLGRVNATAQVISLGTLPLGALIGGVLGELVGVRPTLFVGALGICLSSVVIWHSPLRRLERMPRPLLAEPARS